MIQMIIERLSELPKEIVVFLLAMLPISELRGALPVAVLAFKFSYVKAAALSIVGNIVPVLPILLCFDKIEMLLRKTKISSSILELFLSRAQHKSKALEKYGFIGLIFFVGIPLPVTGAWTGSLIAFLLGFKPLKAFLYIICGILMASIIVSILTFSGVALISGI